MGAKLANQLNSLLLYAHTLCIHYRPAIMHDRGCQESKEICDPVENCLEIEQPRVVHKVHWNFVSTRFSRSASDAAILLALLLAFSTIGDIESGAVELLAERFRSGSRSLALDNKYWQAETRRLFDISLACLQGKVVNVARGKNSNMANYQSKFPDVWKEACSSIKIQTTAWRNLNLTEFVCFSASLLFLWISTVRYGEHILFVRICRVLTGLVAQESYKIAKCGADVTAAISRTVGAMLWRKPHLPFRQPSA